MNLDVAMKRLLTTGAFLAVLLLFHSTCPAAVYPDGFYEVGQIADGDTFDLADGQRVRLIGIDAPEFDQECADQATRFLASLISGRTVYLERDVSDKDGLSRLLRYVYVDGVLVNYEVVLQGFAFAEENPPDLAYSADLAAAEDSAASNHRGCLWGRCPSGTFVFIAFTGSTFHKTGCPYLGEGQSSICLDDALAQGYTACSVCCADTGGGYIAVVSGGCFIGAVEKGPDCSTETLQMLLVTFLAILMLLTWRFPAASVHTGSERKTPTPAHSRG